MRHTFTQGILFLIIGFLSVTAFSQQKILNIYNWSDYIPPKVIILFEKQTGIHVNYSTYTSNSELYAKLLADPDSGYDVIFPSSYYVQRMVAGGMLHPLSLKKLTHFKDLNPALLNRSFDPGNHYSVPYLWGTTGLIVNDKFYNPKSITRWRDLWQKRFHGQLLLLNDVRDVFSVGLVASGYSINTKDPKKIKQAYLKLKQLLPNVKLFTNDGTHPIYIDEDAGIGMILSGDAQQVVINNLHTHYLYPKHPIVWIDCVSIPVDAPHLANAYRFINFITQPKIAKMISVDLSYSSPNLAAIKLMSKKLRANPIINPPASLLRHAQVEGYVGNKATRLYLHYWELLKLSA